MNTTLSQDAEAQAFQDFKNHQPVLSPELVATLADAFAATAYPEEHHPDSRRATYLRELKTIQADFAAERAAAAQFDTDGRVHIFHDHHDMMGRFGQVANFAGRQAEPWWLVCVDDGVSTCRNLGFSNSWVLATPKEMRQFLQQHPNWREYHQQVADMQTLVQTSSAAAFKAYEAADDAVTLAHSMLAEIKASSAARQDAAAKRRLQRAQKALASMTETAQALQDAYHSIREDFRSFTD